MRGPWLPTGKIVFERRKQWFRDPVLVMMIEEYREVPMVYTFSGQVKIEKEYRTRDAQPEDFLPRMDGTINNLRIMVDTTNAAG